ncbi:hypothetical protein C8U37_1027 [Trichococcus patagoniensis]|uniref:Uncharacterized protein n=1 Tax=Trichococcus patagoniensis TaxID=382641 RepID=A0A2T5IQ03_9LACT|nr:hypothetical protein C8U37_1027 [Trichococcus patagoniensis]
MFCAFRYSFSRQMRGLSSVRVTILGGRPTDERSVWCFALFGIRSVERCVDSRVFELPSWADARQKHDLSGLLRFSVFVQSRDASALGCTGYHPALAPDRRSICLVFCAFRYPFCREMRPLSAVPDTVLGVRPTDVLFVWSFALFGIRSVESCGHSRVFRLPSWAYARQISILSGVMCFSVSVLPADARCLGCTGYRPRRTPDRRAFCLVFGGFRYSFCRQMRAVSGVPVTVLGGRPTDARSVWCLVVFDIHSVDTCGRSRVFRLPSWAGARQKHDLSGLLRFSVSVQSRDASALGCTGYHPALAPDRRSICLVFCAFRYSFCRELRALSGVRVTVLGVRPTKVRSLWFFAVFGIRSVERCGRSRVFWIPSWADARQMRVLSGFLRFSVFVHSRDASALGCSGYRPGLTPDKSAICLVFCAFRYSFSRELRPLSGVRDTVLGVRPTDVLFVWSFAVFGIRSVESCGISRVYGIPSWADARQMRVLSGVLRFSVSVQSRDAPALGCTGYRPGRSPDRRAFCLVFCGFR